MAGSATFIRKGKSRSHFTMCGFRHEQVADSLSEENWTNRWCVRVDLNGWLCIGVAELYRTDGTSFGVEVIGRGGLESSCKYKREFMTLGEALAYANGDGDTELARESRRATPEEYPPERSGVTFITSYNGPRPQRKDNQTGESV